MAVEGIVPVQGSTPPNRNDNSDLTNMFAAAAGGSPITNTLPVAASEMRNAGMMMGGWINSPQSGGGIREDRLQLINDAVSSGKLTPEQGKSVINDLNMMKSAYDTLKANATSDPAAARDALGQLNEAFRRATTTLQSAGVEIPLVQSR